MNKKIVFIFGALVLVAGWSCKPSANPNFATNLLNYPTPTPVGPTSTPTTTATPCPGLGADGNPTGNGNYVTGASGSTSPDSYYSGGYFLSSSMLAQSFEAIVANFGTGSETMYAAIYDSSTILVPNSTVTFTVAKGSSYKWQKVDFITPIPMPPGNYTLFAWVTNTGPDVAIGFSTYSGTCQGGKGLTTNISGFPASIGGTSTMTSITCLGLFVSTCP